MLILNTRSFQKNDIAYLKDLLIDKMRFKNGSANFEKLGAISS